MELAIRGKNVKVSEERKELIERKLGKLSHYLELAHEATVELAAEHAHKTVERLVVEMTVRVNGALLRAEERDSDLPKALDRVHDKMQRQLTRYKERLTEKKGRVSIGDAASLLQQQTVEEPQVITPEEEPKPVKVKSFELKPMFVSEAIEELENVDHDFFVFLDAGSSKINVVYRRNDGAFGLLKPELA